MVNTSQNKRLRTRVTTKIIITRDKINVKTNTCNNWRNFYMTTNYEKSESEEKAQNQRDNELGTRGVGRVQRKSPRNGSSIQIRTDQADCKRVHTSERSNHNRRQTNFGKILSQLRELQQSHLAYVESHEERLRARLKAAEEHHDQVLNQMKLLEQEILSLLGESSEIKEN